MQITSDPTTNLAFAFGGPTVSGLVKQTPSDFRVDEIPGFTPDGDGDHVYLTIEKTGLTTNDVARRLRQFCDLHHRDIGYAGMKDKQAITSQVFSLNLSGKPEPDWMQIKDEQIRVLSVSRHKRKLKRGVLKGNQFTIVIRNLQGDISALSHQLERIQQQGVPNYFGSQRFGIEGNNIELAKQLFDHQLKHVKRDKRSILLSSVRSWLFNAVLHERVLQDNWYKLVPGEVINLDSTERHFVETIDEQLINRAERLDIHPTGPLYGLPSRALKPTAICGEIEKRILQVYPELLAGLEAFKLAHARRPLRVAVRDLKWELKDKEMMLSFSLTSGAYATVVMREFLKNQ